MGIIADMHKAELARLEKEDKIIHAENLKIHVNGLILKVWRGKSSKPFYHYRMINKERLDLQIGYLIKASKEYKAFKVEQKSKEKAQALAMRDQIQVGTLLHGSWGYDQTNCEFYQVVSKKGWYVEVRSIGGKTVEDSEGYMCENFVPKKDSFIGDPIRKKITAFGLSMKHFSLSPCNEWESFYSSHYA